MSIGIYNARSAIAKEFVPLIGGDRVYTDEHITPNLDRYLFCSGFLAGQRMIDMDDDTFMQTMRMNFGDIVGACDHLIDANPKARICIIGSESAFAGSFDSAYAGAKAAIHEYIAHKTLTGAGQQLVGIAPTIIWDSGMTQRRTDIALCEKRGANRRRGRWLYSAEVARLAHFLLYTDTGSVSNVVIRQNGGNW